MLTDDVMFPRGYTAAFRYQTSYKEQCKCADERFFFTVSTHTVLKMFSLKKIIVTIFSLLAVAHSQQFYIQNWGNWKDTTNYTYTSLAAGRFTVDWILGPGGNFVAGKGYRGSQNLFVIHSGEYSSYEIFIS